MKSDETHKTHSHDSSIVDVFTDPNVMSMPFDSRDLAAAMSILFDSLGYMPFFEVYGDILCYTHNGKRLQIDTRGCGYLRSYLFHKKEDS